MINYGKKLKEIRLFKGFTLEEASKGILTKSGLSKFERGETSITFDKLLRILNRLSISIEEYDFYCNNSQLSDFDFLIQKVETAYVANNAILLKHLANIEFEKFNDTGLALHKLNAIMISVLYEDISKDIILKRKDVSFLTDYLFSLEQWFYYDIVLFGNSITKLPYELIRSISNDMVLKTALFGKIPANRRLIAQTILNTAMHYFKSGMIDYSQGALLAGNNFINQTDFQEKFISSFLDACIKYLTPSQDNQKVLDILAALKELVDEEVYINYYDFYKTIVEPQKTFNKRQ